VGSASCPGGRRRRPPVGRPPSFRVGEVAARRAPSRTP
jgi:hypothetical protein